MVVDREDCSSARRPFSRTIEDQLVLHEHGFGHHGTGAAGTGEAGDCRQQMQKQDDQIAFW
jgi:hypothetical protein